MEILQDLLLLEEQEGSVNFKFGVIYAKEGQTTDDEMLSNGNEFSTFFRSSKQENFFDLTIFFLQKEAVQVSRGSWKLLGKEYGSRVGTNTEAVLM